MNCVEFFVQNEGQENPVCFERNWNIRNIMSTIMMLDPQVGHGVVSYYFRMVVGYKVVTVSNRAIEVNEDVPSKGEVIIDETDSANDLFEVFMDTQYEDYEYAIISVLYDGDNIIRFICDEIDVDNWNPVVAEEVKTNQWVKELRDTRKYPFYICTGPKAGQTVYMTNAEALAGRIF